MGMETFVDTSLRRSLRAQADLRQSGVAVALGGGGARGLAHLGVMRAITSTGIRVERIVGVSIGSLMGSLCALDTNISRVESKVVGLLQSPTFSGRCETLARLAERLGKRGKDHEDTAGPLNWFASWYRRLERMMGNGRRFSRIVTGPNLLSNVLLLDAIEQLIPDIDVNETEVPLGIVAADLVSGQRVVIENGPLRKAILASMSIPGFFPPVEWDDMLLTDIGVLDSLPIQMAKSYGCHSTIAVDVSSYLRKEATYRTAVDVMLRMEELGELICRRHALTMADLIIRPSVGEYPWYDFTRPERLIELGFAAGKQTLAESLAR